ncbi:MAG: queuosine precursor transporter [Novosphingobium sp.]
MTTEIWDRPTKLFWPLVLAYVTFQLISDVTAGKVVQIGPAVVSVSALYFPFTFLISDILTEVYGFARARRALWLVMAASIVAGLVYQVVVALPPGPGFTANEAYATVFGSVPRILLGGWIAVFVGAYLNDLTLSRMKVMTEGKALWMRTIGSTIVGEGANTALFYTIGLYGIMPNDVLVQAILWGWLIKVAVEVVLTPLTYAAIAKVKAVEGLDTFDRNEGYSPFRF